MVTKLLVNVDTPNIRPEHERDLRTLAVDCLQLMKRNSEFPIKIDVIDLPEGTALTAPSEIVVQLIANKPLLTKADLKLRYGVTDRTLERKVKSGELPRPTYVRGPRWRAEALAKFETDHYPHRD
jgi:hypothetical protein